MALYKDIGLWEIGAFLLGRARENPLPDSIGID